VAIMWANHNPPNTHSVEDWRAVTQHWIDHYFSLNSYYQIDGKPAIFIWDPQNIRRDVGGTQVVRGMFEESQAMAQRAGYAGVTFVAMGYDFSSSQIEALLEQGYSGITTYHEWGTQQPHVLPLKQGRFEVVIETSPQAWMDKDRAAGPLTYYPVVDTGWDSRPWHGEEAFVILGRTPDLFERLLRNAKAFCEQRGKTILVLGPVNEWGEGSYIEPCTEFGFDMLERVRKVFTSQPPETWPTHVAPQDVGLGPYDFPKEAAVTAWSFESGETLGWTPMMNVRDWRCEDGALRFQTTSDDPAILVSLHGAPASAFKKAQVRMRLARPAGVGNSGQLFWATGGAAITEATSTRFLVESDGQFHTYTLNLAENPRWRGRITQLRFDPCNQANVEVAIEESHLLPGP